MRSPPILHESNREDDVAREAASRARAHGEAIIGDHLANHLDHNPGRSSDYVTWVATLHPENADVTVDQRFFIPGNPWWRIYEERVKNQRGNNDIPSATAVPVGDPLAPSRDTESQQGAQQPLPPLPHWCLRVSPIDMFSGLLIALLGFGGVFLTETLALFSYFVGAAFYWMARPFSPLNPFTGIFYSFLMVFYWSWALIDSLTLLASVLLAESVAAAAWLTSCCFGGVIRANQWHQYVRRNCHVIRAAYRKPFNDPPRHFCIVGGNAGRRVAGDEGGDGEAGGNDDNDHNNNTNDNEKGYEREVIVITDPAVPMER